MVAQVTPLTSDASRLADASPDGEVNCSEASGYETVPVMGGRTADEPADAKMWVHASWRPRRPLKRVRTRWARTERALEHLREEERGAVTAEYAIVMTSP